MQVCDMGKFLSWKITGCFSHINLSKDLFDILLIFFSKISFALFTKFNPICFSFLDRAGIFVPSGVFPPGEPI